MKIFGLGASYPHLLCTVGKRRHQLATPDFHRLEG